MISIRYYTLQLEELIAYEKHRSCMMKRGYLQIGTVQEGTPTGPPIAPNNIASAPFAAVSAPSVKGSPFVSIEIYIILCKLLYS